MQRYVPYMFEKNTWYDRKANKLTKYRRGKRLMTTGRKRPMYVNPSSRIYRINRTGIIRNIACSGAGTLLYADSFSIDQVPNYGEFTALWDKYRLRYVTLKFYYATTNFVSSAQSVQNETGFLHIVKDYNDAQTPGDVLDLMQYPNYRCIPLQKLQGYKMVIKPKWEQTAYRSGVTSGYGQGNRWAWLDCTSTGITIPHFGIKYVIEKSGDPAEKFLRIACTYHIDLKEVH